MEPNNVDGQSPLQNPQTPLQADFSNQTPSSKKIPKIIASVVYLILLIVFTKFFALGGLGYWIYFPYYYGILILGIVFALVDLKFKDSFSTFIAYVIFAIYAAFPHTGPFGYLYFNSNLMNFLSYFISVNYLLYGLSPFIFSSVHKCFKTKNFKPAIVFIGSILVGLFVFSSIALAYKIIYPSKIIGYNNINQKPTATQFAEMMKIQILDNCTIFNTKEELSRSYEKNCKLLLDDQQISTIPPEIFTWDKIQLLALSNNNISILPPEIEKLANLIILDLSGNQLTELPKEILSLKKLDTINLSNNKFDDSEKIKIYEMLPNVNISFYSGEWTTGANFVKYSNACAGGSDVTCKNSKELSVDTIKTAAPGSTISFQGKISNQNSYRLYYKGGSASVQSDGIDIDYTLISKIVPGGISAKGNYSGEFFQIKIGKDVKPGTYNGLFILTLGKDEINPDSGDKEYDMSFQVVVTK